MIIRPIATVMALATLALTATPADASTKKYCGRGQYGALKVWKRGPVSCQFAKSLADRVLLLEKDQPRGWECQSNLPGSKPDLTCGASRGRVVYVNRVVS